MTGKNVTLPEEVSRTVAPKGDRSKACREKSAEAIVLLDGQQEGPKLMEVMPRATKMIM